MAACPACDFEIDVDEFDVEQGDELSCPECGANLEVAGVLPVELTLVSDDDGEEDDPPDPDEDDGADGDSEDPEDDDWEG